MTGLLTPSEVAAAFGVRDPRTVRRRLAELQVPIVPAGRSFLVREVDLERAVAAAVVVVTPDVLRVTRHGSVVAPGARLWDDEPENQVSPRRVNARARGTRNETPVRVKPTEGPTAPLGSLPRASEQEETS